MKLFFLAISFLLLTSTNAQDFAQTKNRKTLSHSHFNTQVVQMQQDVVLPEFVSINANMANNRVQLNWSTANTNNNLFEVQQLGKDSTYQTIGLISGTDEILLKEFSFQGIAAQPEINYYRIKQTTNNGQYIYSKTVSILGSKELAALLIYPSPAVNKITIQLPDTDSNTYYLYSICGKLLATKVSINGQSAIDWDIAHLKAGTYFVKTATQKTTAFIKK